MPFIRHGYVAAPAEIEATSPDGQATLSHVLELLRARGGHDFGRYKHSTLRRRVHRRLGLRNIETLDEYIDELRTSPDEVTTLVGDLMISVTGFFRDAGAWKALAELVIAPMVAEREIGTSIRVWAPASRIEKFPLHYHLSARKVSFRPQRSSPPARAARRSCLPIGRSPHAQQGLDLCHMQQRERHWLVVMFGRSEEDQFNATVAVEAGTASEALTVFTSSLPIDLVFSDIQMPGEMDGFGLASVDQATTARVEVVLTSGYEKAADMAAELCDGGPLISKPYDQQLVVDRIKRLLAVRSRGLVHRPREFRAATVSDEMLCLSRPQRSSA